MYVVNGSMRQDWIQGRCSGPQLGMYLYFHSEPIVVTLSSGTVFAGDFFAAKVMPPI